MLPVFSCQVQGERLHECLRAGIEAEIRRPLETRNCPNVHNDALAPVQHSRKDETSHHRDSAHVDVDHPLDEFQGGSYPVEVLGSWVSHSNVVYQCADLEPIKVGFDSGCVVLESWNIN
jgi:hypothetical protein